jgi:hypothetical protein
VVRESCKLKGDNGRENWKLIRKSTVKNENGRGEEHTNSIGEVHLMLNWFFPL